MVQNSHPRLHRRELRPIKVPDAMASLEQFDEVTLRQPLGHLMRVVLSRLLHDMAVRRTGSHEGVTAHVLVFHVVGTLHRVIEGLAFGIVRAHDEVLHVLHTGAFETGPQSAGVRNEVRTYAV